MGSDLQLTGLASGFDWKPVVEQLVELEAIPKQRLQSEKSANESKVSDLGLLKSQLDALNGAAGALNNDDLYEGSIDSPACLNGNVIEVNSNFDAKESILLTGLPLLTDYSDTALVAMVKDFQKWKKVRMIGSAAMASAYVASGKADMYKESGAFLWDVAAGAAIINAANGEALLSNQKDNYQVDVAFTNRNLNK